jgi:hypothetical protein
MKTDAKKVGFPWFPSVKAGGLWAQNPSEIGFFKA